MPQICLYPVDAAHAEMLVEYFVPISVALRRATLLVFHNLSDMDAVEVRVEHPPLVTTEAFAGSVLEIRTIASHGEWSHGLQRKWLAEIAIAWQQTVGYKLPPLFGQMFSPGRVGIWSMIVQDAAYSTVEDTLNQ